MPVESSISQRGRLFILVTYLGGLLITSQAALGTWLPPTNGRGLWFYAALAALLLGNLLVTPFFTKPADAISYAVAAAIALLSVNAWRSSETGGFDRFIWTVALLYVLAVLAAAITAIVAKDSPHALAQKTARSGLLLADVAGSPRAIFSVVFLFSLITYHRAVPREYLIIGLAWMVFVGLRPLETMVNLSNRLRALWMAEGPLVPFGQVVGHETPGLILIRENADAGAALGDLLVARTEGGQPGLAIALDHVGFASGCWLRAMHLPRVRLPQEKLGDPRVARLVTDGAVFRASEAVIAGDARERADDTRQRLLGLVASETTVGQLQVELIRADLGLQEGSLLEVVINDRPVLFQVIKGLTKEEVLQEKNTRGFVRA